MNRIFTVQDKKLLEVVVDLDQIIFIAKTTGRVQFKHDQYLYLPGVENVNELIKAWSNWLEYK